MLNVFIFKKIWFPVQQKDYAKIENKIKLALVYVAVKAKVNTVFILKANVLHLIYT